MKNRLLELGFIDNEYLSKYLDLIEQNKDNPKQKMKTQAHHVVPVCVFVFNHLKVDNAKQNMVNLSFKNHILAHYYLCLCTKGQLKHKLQNAFLHLVNCKYDLGSFNPETDLDEFQNLYKDYIFNLSQKYLGKGISDKTCYKKGHVPFTKGKKRPEISELFKVIFKGRHLHPETEIKKGQRISPATEFKKGDKPQCPFLKGNVPWNAGRHDLPPSWNKGRTGALSHCSKTVYQYTLDLELVKIWGSIGEVERELHFAHTAIGYCCNGKRKTSHGFIWSFKKLK